MITAASCRSVEKRKQPCAERLSKHEALRSAMHNLQLQLLLAPPSCERLTVKGS